jgi:uncharacterized membrane protein (TIGR02234 family)
MARVSCAYAGGMAGDELGSPALGGAADDPALQARRAGRRELALLVLLGAAGAGLVLLATRQGWARVETAAPRPLPASVTTETGQALVPVAGALALAALAGLAAVLATRRLLRRVAGVVLGGLGVGIAAAVGAGISAADVLAAAAASSSAQTGSGAAPGSDIGSTTAGGTGQSGAAGTPVSGLPSHVVFAAFPWRELAFAGALAIVAAGVLVTWRAASLPVMSSRFELPARSPGSRPVVATGGGYRGSDAASIWESLSRGEDPTGPP